ncbi:MAG: hypothetical protein WD249_02355, partial [Gaiellaceae bacterium]
RARVRATRSDLDIRLLERLVAEHGDAFPDRQLEWEAYLYHLREFAAEDGSLPQRFRALVDDVFGALLRAR